MPCILSLERAIDQGACFDHSEANVVRRYFLQCRFTDE